MRKRHSNRGRRANSFVLTSAALGVLVIAFVAIIPLMHLNVLAAASSNVTYTVRSGDSLYSIGQMYGIPWQNIAQANNIPYPYTIYVGEVLVIPTGSSSSTSLSSTTNCSQTTSVTAYYYTVQSGDYLSLIGAKLGVPWMSIAQANNIPYPYTIYVGEQLLIPAGGTTTSRSCSSTSSSSSSLSSTSTSSSSSSVTTSTTTSSTSTTTTTTTTDSSSSTSSLTSSSSSSSSSLSSSSTAATTDTTTVTSTTSPSYFQYTVKGGDTLYQIGKTFNVPWQQIAKVNRISSPYTLYVGEILLIPTSSSTTTATSSSNSTTTITTTITSNTTSTTTSTNGTSRHPKYVMLRFDDSFQSQWVNVLPILQKYGFKACFAPITGVLTNDGISSVLVDGWQDMSWQELQWLYQNGYQIVDHTVSHPDLTQLSSAQLNIEVTQSLNALNQHGMSNVTNFALPYGAGAGNQTVLSAISQGGFKYTYTAWGVPGILGYSKIQTQWIGIDAADSDTSLADFQSYANMASDTFAVGFMFHHVDDHVYGTTYYVNVTQFAQDMAYLSSQGFTVILPLQLPGY